MKRFGQREGGALPAGGPLAGCRATGRHGWECVRSAAMLFDMTRPICRNHWTATAFGGYYAQHTICLLWTCNRWQVDGMQRLVCVEGLACVRSLSTAPHPMPTPPRHPPPPPAHPYPSSTPPLRSMAIFFENSPLSTLAQNPARLPTAFTGVSRVLPALSRLQCAENPNRV